MTYKSVVCYLFRPLTLNLLIFPNQKEKYNHRLYLLYLSTSFLWWQAVAGIIGVKSSNALRINLRCTWQPREGRETSTTPPSAARSARCAHAGASLQTSTADPEGWHRSGTLSRSGTTRWRTREEKHFPSNFAGGAKRPHRLIIPRDAMPARLSSFRLLAMASPHWMLVGSS